MTKLLVALGLTTALVGGSWTTVVAQRGDGSGRRAPEIARQGGAAPTTADGPGPRRPGASLERRLRNLNLTDEQRERIRAILREARTGREPLRDELREKRRDTRARLGEVLTPAQREQIRRPAR